MRIQFHNQSINQSINQSNDDCKLLASHKNKVLNQSVKHHKPDGFHDDDVFRQNFLSRQIVSINMIIIPHKLNQYSGVNCNFSNCNFANARSLRWRCESSFFAQSVCFQWKVSVIFPVMRDHNVLDLFLWFHRALFAHRISEVYREGEIWRDYKDIQRIIRWEICNRKKTTTRNEMGCVTYKVWELSRDQGIRDQQRPTLLYYCIIFKNKSFFQKS